MKEFGKHSLWIYGVVVGLAIREAVTGETIHLHDGTFYQEFFLESGRFLIFLFVISRFYLGAAHYFEKVHGDGSEELYPSHTKSFGMDFMMGLIHFLSFFAWAHTLMTHHFFKFGFSSALIFMGFILCYDVVWLYVSRDYSSRNDIAKWATLNVAAVLSGLLFFVVFRAGYELYATAFPDHRWINYKDVAATTSELVALGPVVWFGLKDFGMLIRGDDSVPPILQRFVKVFQWSQRYPGCPIASTESSPATGM